MNIAGVEVGTGPCKVACEVGNAHNGDLNRALRLLDAIKASGAAFAKLQAYRPDELVELRGDGPAPEPWGSQGYTMRTLYQRAATPHYWFPKLTRHCEEIGLPWFSSVFGYGSLCLLEALGCPAYKLASLDRWSRSLLKMVRKTGKPIIRSLPAPASGDDFTLYCPPSYPQSVFNLRAELPKFGGFSYHGTDVHVPLAAAILGAQMIEVHVQLDEEPSELESSISLGLGTVAKLISAIEVLRPAL